MRMSRIALTLMTAAGLFLAPLPLANAVGDSPSAPAAPGTGAVADSRALPAGLHRCKSPKKTYCGHLKVKLDRTGHVPGKIRIGFEYYPATGQGTSGETIVAHEGGPGYSTTGSRDYYVDLFNPMRKHHALLLVDERGTGRSEPIHCPEAQSYSGGWVSNAAKCGRELGDRSDLYNTANAAQDMADVLNHLGISTIDLYGDSYGSFFSQTFATRFPGQVRALILDGTYPITDLDPWYATTATRLRDNLKLFCSRSRPTCPVKPNQMVSLARRVVDQLRLAPVTTQAPASNGKTVTVTLTPRRLLDTLLYSDTTPGYVREIPAALVAFKQGDARPLARMVAEVNGPSTNAASKDTSERRPNGGLRGYSEGAYLAYACTDYPQVWNVHADRDKRHRQYRQAARQLPWSMTRPWTPPEWVDSDFFTYNYCINWPKPRVAEPPFPKGGSYPSTPTLVLNGDEDLRTDVYQAQEVAANFPNSTYVEVPNYGHVTAVYDADRCSSVIVRRFVRTLDAGDTSCVNDVSEHRVVKRFAKHVADAPQATVAGKSDRSSAADRRAAYVAVESISDVVDRWYAIPGYTGVGLYGGTFSMYTTFGNPFTSRVWSLKLNDVKWTKDVKVSGKGTIPRGNGRASFDLTVSGRGTAGGTLHLHWMSRQAHEAVTITGHLGGHRVNLTAPAPSYY